MIANITRGNSADGLGRYLQGPGTTTPHHVPGTDQVGGMVVARSAELPTIRVGSTEHRGWARRMQKHLDLAPTSERSLWHCSLNLAPEDRRLSPQEWEAAAIDFMEQMGASDRAWVAIQHDDSGIHIAMARPHAEHARMWSDRNDFKRAQTARKSVERMFDLSRTRTRKGPAESHHEQQIREKEDELRTQAKAQPDPLDVHAGGFHWQVRARRDGRCYVWRESEHRPGLWRLVKDGIRALGKLLIGRDLGGGDPPILDNDPVLTGPPPPPPSAGYGPQPGRGPGR